MSKRVRVDAGRRGSSSGSFARWTAAASVLIGFGLAAWTAVGHISTGNPKLSHDGSRSVWRASLTPAAGQVDSKGAPQSAYLFSRSTAFSTQLALADKPAVRAQRLAGAGAVVQAADDPFDAVVKKAKLSPGKLASAFKRARPSDAPLKIALAEPAPERFGLAASLSRKHAAAIELAYAAPSETRAAQALHSLADEESRSLDDLAALPGQVQIPESAPIPSLRPKTPTPKAERAALPQADTDESDAARTVPGQSKPATQPVVRQTPEDRPLVDKPRQRLATGRQNEPGAEKLNGGLGWSFRNIFGGSGVRAGKDVAVYDISAAKVYMPDGSVLEAHSGIGKMADNPKYVNVKMNGPTPPHTYNLKMRETRFHGVEAIRMLPVDGKNKHGRDGFLTHSYLLRGRTAQSHGCVAFKDYNKFLNAFKKGKIKQMVVVSSGGRAAATRLASN